MKYQRRKLKLGRSERKGVAAAEFAIVAPLLVLITLGAIDAGQSVNVAQIVNDASREGARQATRSDVTDVDEVEMAVKSFLADAFPGVSEDALCNAVTVSVGDSVGDGIPGGDLGTIDSGGSVSVGVSLQYAAVRWIVFLPGFNEIALETTTVMRRE